MEKALEEERNFAEPLDSRFIGHTIPLTCGHTGQPSSEEAYLMEKHLRAAGFIKQSDKDPTVKLVTIQVSSHTSPKGEQSKNEEN